MMKLSIFTVIALALVLTGVRCQDLFQLADIYVDNWTVSAETILYYQFQINRNSDYQVKDGDYLLIKIPEDSSAYWVESKTNIWDVGIVDTERDNRKPNCTVQGGREPMDCMIVNERVAKVVFHAQQNLIIRGSISRWVNPHSIKEIFSIEADLYSVSQKRVVVTTTSLRLNSFDTTTLQVLLESSSNVIGKQNNVLKISVTPSTILSYEGYIIVKLPEYYEGAGQVSMIGNSNPNPCRCPVANIKSCYFSSRLRQLTIHYNFKDQKDHNETVDFEVGQFNNPIVEDKGGFFVESLDEQEYLIAETSEELKINGINEPAQFKSWDFNFVDTAASGKYAIHQFILLSSMPIQKNCLIKIKYPSDFEITNQLTSMVGSGFFSPVGGALQFKSSPKDNTIEITACQKNYGQHTSGVLTLQKVMNQVYIHDSASFEIYMTEEKDKTFSRVYQKITSGFIVLQDWQRPGDMQGKIEASSTLVQTFAHLSFELEPSISLSTDSYIIINVPNSLEFQGPSCTVLNMHGGFSQDMSCSRVNHQITLWNPFDYKFDIENASILKMTIEEFLMPQSVFDIGTIEVITYDFRDGEYRPIDLFEYKDLKTVSGAIFKLSEVVVDSNTTSLIDQTYIFNFKLTHSVPVGGFFSILLSEDEANGVKISNPEKEEQSCFLMVKKPGNEVGEPEYDEIGLDCHSGRIEDGRPFVNITCTESAFGEFGTEKGEDFMFKIQGLTNPRLKDYVSYFKIYTLDKDFRYIDQNFKDQEFFVIMSNLKALQSVSVDMLNKTNGAYTDYYISLIPSTSMHTGDEFKITFPEQITLPFDMQCSSYNEYIQSFFCQRVGENQVLFKLTNLLTHIQAGFEIKWTIHNVMNSPSLRPSSKFEDMVLVDNFTRQAITQYHETIIVQTNELGQLDKTTATLIQSTIQPEALSETEIGFDTNIPLPTSAAIVLTIPRVISEVNQENNRCYVKLNGVEMEGNCTVKDYQIIFSDFFSHISSRFEGRIQLLFETNNPVDNIGIAEESYTIRIYDDSDLLYGIDELKDVLYPQLQCQYPCKTCLKSNQNFCTSCLPQSIAPQFLFMDGDVQTCIDYCPDTYTSDGTKDPRICKKCADTCVTCAQDDIEGDVDRCLTCNERFENYWIEKFTCHSFKCPEGSYQSNEKKCSSCLHPCKACSDRLTCTKCEAKSELKYLFEGQCLSECPIGYTPIDNVCVICKSPCATCDLGQIESCTSCDNTSEKQFLFGKTCMNKCPLNTTLDLEEKVCKGCKNGCQMCNQKDNSICLRCIEGLAMLNDTCLQECPFQYVKSSDGTVCEKRTYPLDYTFIFFPILGTALFFVLITFSSFWLTARRSLITSTLIAFFGPIEMAACLYQFLYSSQEDRNFIPIKIGSICVLISGLILNFVFVFNFYRTVIQNDQDLKHWIKVKKFSFAFFMLISSCISMTLFRLSFSKLFRLEMMNIEVSKPLPFLRCIFIFTTIKMLIFNFPLVIVDIYGLSILSWGNQCFMTMLESATMSIISLLLMIDEYYNQKKKLLTRESKQVSLDKLDKYKDKDGYKMKSKGAHRLPQASMVVPEVSNKYFAVNDSFHEYAKCSFNQSGTDIHNINKSDLGHISPMTVHHHPGFLPDKPINMYTERIDQLSKLILQVKNNKKLNLDFGVDNNLEDSASDISIPLDFHSKEVQVKVRRCKSGINLKSKTHNNLNDENVSDCDSTRLVQSQTYYKTCQDVKVDEIKQRVVDLKNLKFKSQPLGYESEEEQTQLSSQKDEQEQPLSDIQSFGSKQMSDTKSSHRVNMKEQMKMALTNKLVTQMKENAEGKQEDEDMEITSDQQRVLHEKINEILDIAMFFQNTGDMPKFENFESVQQFEMSWMDKLIIEYDKKISTKRVGQGDQSHTHRHFMSYPGETHDMESEITESQPSQHAMSPKSLDQKKKEKVLSWINDQSDALNQRSFNYNEIIGKFERDSDGNIIQKDYILKRNGYRDMDGNPVNKRGYLIDEETGDIRSKYTFEPLFKRHELLGKDRCELPLPYRLEKYNFNPHQCFGNFDYNKKGDPIFVMQHGQRHDKNQRMVNEQGWLVDSNGNIIDNMGKIKFIKQQLTSNGDIPPMYNYEGSKSYKIKNIIGQFDQYEHSKEIILRVKDFKSCDMLGRKVNNKGYLLDDKGNIIDKSGKVIWNSHELLFNEPPKIFKFTEFSMSWIKGRCEKDVTQNPMHNDEYDLDGRRINSCGYLVDHQDNIIDIFGGNIIFKKNILEKKYGQDAEIPMIFRNGRLRIPQMDSIEKELHDHEFKVYQRPQVSLAFEPDTNPEKLKCQLRRDINELHKNMDYIRRSKMTIAETKLEALKDMFGEDIPDIEPTHEQMQLLFGFYDELEEQHSKRMDEGSDRDTMDGDAERPQTGMLYGREPMLQHKTTKKNSSIFQF